MTTQGFINHGSLNPDNLLGGEFPRVARTVTIIKGEDLKAGSVLGKITADGKYKLAALEAKDGSEIPDAILAEDVEAASTDKQGLVYLSGEFNERALSFGTGTTVNNARDTLRAKCIYLTINQD